MKRKFHFVIFTFCLVFINAQKIKDKKQLDNANTILNNYIKKQLKNEKPKPSEFKSARKLYRYDIDDDGDKDIIAFYTLEGFGGGNNWQH